MKILSVLSGLWLSFYPALVVGQSQQYQRKSSAKNPTAETSETYKSGNGAANHSGSVRGSGKATPVNSNGEASKTSSSPASDKINVKELEEKYWAPKDTDFSVVQNRAYTKEKRFALSVEYGPIINDSFSRGMNLGVGASYYFSERMGAELYYLNPLIGDSKLRDTFYRDFGLSPDFNRLTQLVGVSYHFVPIYAKMSLLGSKILYFDLAISPGIGYLTYDQFVIDGNRSDHSIALTLDVSQQFFLTQHLAIRLDLKNWFYNEVIREFKATGRPSGSVLRKESAQATFFLMGITFYF